MSMEENGNSVSLYERQNQEIKEITACQDTRDMRATAGTTDIWL
jgi:hypothetical protein